MWWFWTVYGSALAALIGWGVWLYLRWKDMPDLAETVYDERIASGELPKRTNREAFAAAFIESEGPRRETYRWAAAISSLLLLPILVRIFNIIWNLFWAAAGKPGVFEEGYMIHTFSTYLFAMGVVITILYFTMRRYYRSAPPSLKAQIRKLNGDAA